MDHPHQLLKLAEQRHQELIQEAEVHRMIKQANPSQQRRPALPKIGHVLAAISQRINLYRCPEAAPSAC